MGLRNSNNFRIHLGRFSIISVLPPSNVTPHQALQPARELEVQFPLGQFGNHTHPQAFWLAVESAEITSTGTCNAIYVIATPRSLDIVCLNPLTNDFWFLISDYRLYVASQNKEDCILHNAVSRSLLRFTNYLFQPFQKIIGINLTIGETCVC